MKKTRSLVGSLLACGVALAMITTVTAQTTQERVVKVLRVKGPARYMAPGGQWQNLSAGTVLHAGYVVQTAKDSPGSFVDLVVGEGVGVQASGPPMGVNPYAFWAGTGVHKPRLDQDGIRLMENTALAIDKLLVTDTGEATITETQLDLRKGHIIGNVKKMTAGSRYEIKYPNGVAGIRGSTYDMNLTESTANGQTVVNCVLGMVNGSAVLSFIKPDGSTIAQTILPTQSFDTSTGVMGTIPPDLQSYVQQVIMDMTVPQQVEVRFITPSQAVITPVSSTKGVGLPPTPGGGE